jgi:SAM-dependent methyltransferase
MNMHVPSLQRSLSDVVAEYDTKAAAIDDAIKAFESAGDDLKMAATVGGTYGRLAIDTGRVYASSLRECLLKSAWHHVYDGLNIARLASPNDKRLFEQAMAKPPPFTIDNIRGTFGKFVADPRGNILRGLAEVFCGLDQAYKSHDKVRIGVEGLPKRVVLGGFGTYSYYGKERLEVILNALACYQGKPLVTHEELSALLSNEDALLVSVELPATRYSQASFTPGRGIRLRTFKNGNGHLFFEKDTLRDINMALAEFYGDILPDTTDEKPTKKQPGTSVSKDLQYYPTPKAVVDRVISNLYQLTGQRVLEPSCGCGRFMDALRKAGAKPYGIEVDPKRAAQSRAKGHSVLLANFLETVPTGDFDRVVMNPPFYGKHYAKHVKHALEFLKPGGTLTAILPATARYDHGLLDGKWEDLPVGSFSESGTNINTTILTKRAPEGCK